MIISTRLKRSTAGFNCPKTSFGKQSPLIVTKGNGLHAQGWSFWDKDKSHRNLLIQTIAMFIFGMECIHRFTQTRSLKAPFPLLFSKNFSTGKKNGIAKHL